MRKSCYTDRAVAFVTANPGCTKYDLARHLTYSPRMDASKLYYLVNTQIRLGWIRAERHGNRYSLYATQGG